MGNSSEDLAEAEIHPWLSMVFAGEALPALPYILTARRQDDCPERSAATMIRQARPPKVAGLEQLFLSQ